MRACFNGAISQNNAILTEINEVGDGHVMRNEGDGAHEAMCTDRTVWSDLAVADTTKPKPIRAPSAVMARGSTNVVQRAFGTPRPTIR